MNDQQQRIAEAVDRADKALKGAVGGEPTEDQKTDPRAGGPRAASQETAKEASMDRDATRRNDSNVPDYHSDSNAPLAVPGAASGDPSDERSEAGQALSLERGESADSGDTGEDDEAVMSAADRFLLSHADGSTGDADGQQKPHRDRQQDRASGAQGGDRVVNDVDLDAESDSGSFGDRPGQTRTGNER